MYESKNSPKWLIKKFENFIDGLFNINTKWVKKKIKQLLLLRKKHLHSSCVNTCVLPKNQTLVTPDITKRFGGK